MKKIVKKLCREEAPTNNVGTGNIAGLGVGAAGEPGLTPKQMKTYKKKNVVGAIAQRNLVSVFNRKAAIAETTTFVPKLGKFAGNDTFIVPRQLFLKAQNEKKKGKHWKTYVGEDDHGKAIREYDRKHAGRKAIILQDEHSGTMTYAKYGRKGI